MIRSSLVLTLLCCWLCCVVLGNSDANNEVDSGEQIQRANETFMEETFQQEGGNETVEQGNEVGPNRPGRRRPGTARAMYGNRENGTERKGIFSRNRPKSAIDRNSSDSEGTEIGQNRTRGDRGENDWKVPKGEGGQRGRQGLRGSRGDKDPGAEVERGLRGSKRYKGDKGSKDQRPIGRRFGASVF